MREEKAKLKDLIEKLKKAHSEQNIEEVDKIKPELEKELMQIMVKMSQAA